MKPFYLLAVLVLATGACRYPAAQVPAPDPGHVVANLVFAPSDSAVYVAYARAGTTGLYRVHCATGAVQQLVRPAPGHVFSLALRGRTLLALRGRRTPAGYRKDVAAYRLGDSIWTPLATVPAGVVDAAHAPDPDRVLLVLAGDYGHSSPVARSRFRLMDVYSRTATDSVLRRETSLQAYEFFGKLHLDRSGEHAYLNVQFLPGPNASGPYRVHLKTGARQSLLPRNMAQLQPAIERNSAVRGYLTDGLSPTPSPGDVGTFFLHDRYNVYHVDEQTLAGTVRAFRQRPEVHGGVLQIQSLAAMHRSGGAALLLRFGTRGPQLIRLVHATGALADVPLDPGGFRQP